MSECKAQMAPRRATDHEQQVAAAAAIGHDMPQASVRTASPQALSPAECKILHSMPLQLTCIRQLSGTHAATP